MGFSLRRWTLSTELGRNLNESEPGQRAVVGGATPASLSNFGAKERSASSFSLEALLWKKLDRESQVLPSVTLRVSSLSHNLLFFSLQNKSHIQKRARNKGST